jgi:pimeloyl-ACP methyl ester carboxylesterase
MAIDIPGYGRSPTAREGLTMDDMAQACWEAVDDAYPGETCILVGCSVGARLVPHMYHLRPGKTAALIVCGTGVTPTPSVPTRRVKQYRDRGIEFRWGYTFEDFSAHFRATPMAKFFADLFAERNAYADVDTIIHQFHALDAPPPENHHQTIGCPMLIISGSEDNSHQRAFELKERIPGCEMKIVYGAGHACQIEQPWMFNQYMLEFLKKHGLFAGLPKIGKLA